MVPPREGLERDEYGIVLEAQPQIGGRGDLRRSGGPLDPSPADRGQLGPLSNPTLARRNVIPAYRFAWKAAVCVTHEENEGQWSIGGTEHLFG